MDDNIGTMLAQVSRLLRRRFDEGAREIGVTRPQWQVLTLLSRNEGINQGGLADLLEVEPITLGRMIDRLQDAELVVRRADPNDRRAWRLYLTGRGEDLIEQLLPVAREAFAVALEGIGEDEQRQMKAVLERMRANLSRRQPAEAING